MCKVAGKAMETPLIFIFSLLICSVLATPRKSPITHEKLEMEYFDEKYVNVIGIGLAELNDSTIVVNVTGMFKTDIPEDFKVSCRGFKSVNNEYRLRLFHYDTTVKEGLEMELFDLQSLFLKYTRPPLVWPLKKNVVYHSMGWTPDYSKWLPNFPGGKWKFQVRYLFANNTNVMIVNWFGKIED